MAIRKIQHESITLYFVADDLGMPVSFGYLSEAQAEDVAALIESSDGAASIPAGIDVEKILADARWPNTNP